MKSSDWSRMSPTGRLTALTSYSMPCLLLDDQIMLLHSTIGRRWIMKARHIRSALHEVKLQCCVWSQLHFSDSTPSRGGWSIFHGSVAEIFAFVTTEQNVVIYMEFVIGSDISVARNFTFILGFNCCQELVLHARHQEGAASYSFVCRSLF